MRQLTSLDAQFIAIEDGRSHTHVSALAVLDPSTAPGGRLTLDDVVATFRERLHLLPPLRWRLAEVPLGLDHPYWVDDQEFDLEFHVRELNLPHPGTDVQLAEQAARVVSRPLDRARPLWEAYLIGGLEGGRVALLTKLHHAMVDGVSGAEILGILFDLEPTGRELPSRNGDAEPDREPGDLEMLGRGIAGLPRQPVRALRALPSAMPNLDTLPTLRNLPGLRPLSRVSERAHRAATRGRDGRILEHPGMRAPRTRLNGKITPHRRVAFGSLSLSEMKAVKNAFGATVNDVVVALSTAAIRKHLLEHDDLPDEPMLAMVPVSVRTSEQMGTFGNRISVMIVPLATTEPDPLRRLEITHENLKAAKDRHGAVPADILASANHLIPPALLARAAKVTGGISASRRFAPPYNVIISNVPGPPVPLYVAGALQLANYPISFVLDGIGLNVTVLSYQDQVDFGLVADRELVPDLPDMIGYLEEELATLVEAAAADR